MRTVSDKRGQVSDIVHSFPTVGIPAVWNLSQAQIDLWQELFPKVDVPTQLRHALVWSQANPTKRKTARGMMRFLSAWLIRADQNRPVERPTQSRDYCPHVDHCSSREHCKNNMVIGRKPLKAAVAS